MEKKLNKFEQTRLFSARAVEISEGDKPKIETKEGEVKLSNDYIRVAKQEYAEGKIELEIYRD